ncbi:Retrovirus-related Pol polyprotein from transposon 17.6 [Vitis vinifera]|uniref:Retrovirus-related Pol polyprotein from transposon 17.6 n=1 Tax=Vitis vinifera TaxID=29760 RepID=A0A438EZ48_VITVI|nr:Retrovirus-related Pol polyprotein from transposon 17.6 [Vitis vinifera]
MINHINVTTQYPSIHQELPMCNQEIDPQRSRHFVDPPLSFDVLSGFVSRSDYIFDIDDEIAQHDSDDDSSSVFDSDPVDQRVSPAVGDTEIVDFGTADQPRELRIGSDLSSDERYSLIQLLRSYLDVFAWSYEDMPGLDPSIVQHRLPLLPHARPVKQKLRRLHPRWSLQVKEEIQKQLSVGFLSVVEYPEWLANVVPVPKKDSKVRVCVDFRDLNKASPKDDFPLPHIDMLVDSTAGHSMLSFMDGFSGYSQILMAPEDMEKTSFITEWGTYCYRVMPFGLKNAGATYQRAATTLFHDMMHRDVEVYVDDMIVKSRGRSDHLAALESERGIEVDPDKIRAILDMPAPRTEREVRGFLGRLQYISRFIARLTDICEPIFRLLRKSQPTVWDDQCQRAFERIREYLLSPPVLATPTPGRPLLLYLSVSDVALGCMLAQLDDSGKDRAIYYLSKRMLDYETRYVTIERYYLALVWATRRLRHYMTEYSVHLISCLDPLRYLFDRPALIGRLTRWLVLLTEFDIHYVTQKSIRGSIVADHLASLPVSDARAIDDDFPDEDVAAATSLSGWRMYFDGAANHSGYGIGVLLISPHGDHIPDLWRCLVTPSGIETDSGAQNQFADALTTLASMIDIPADATVRPLLIESRSAPAYCCLIDDMEIDDVWGIDIIGKISPKSSSGHEFILVAIDYFTKWVEAASYARLTSSGVASFIRSHIICRYGVLTSLFSDRGVHFRAEVDTLVQRYGIRHHRSSAYRPQTNGAVEAANKNIKRILRKMEPRHTHWYMAWRQCYPLRLRWIIESSIRAADSRDRLAQARFDQLNLLDERRLRAADHVRAYQGKMARAFKKRVKPGPLHVGDLVLRVIRGLIRDPRGKFRPSWSGPYFIRELTPEGAGMADGFRWKPVLRVD